MNSALEMMDHNLNNTTPNYSRLNRSFSFGLRSSLSDKNQRKILNEISQRNMQASKVSAKYGRESHFPPLNALPKLSFANSSKLWKILQQRELKCKNSIDYLRRHPALSKNMREILIDWLIEVCQLYSLHQETLHRAISLMDQYLSITEFQIMRDQFQLLGITCLFTASKVEEIYPPKMSDFIFVTDGIYTHNQMKQQEKLLLQALDFNLMENVTPSTWLRLFCQQLFSNDENSPYISHLAQQTKNVSVNSASSVTICDSFLVPHYPDDLYAECIALLSLICIDYESTKYKPSHLAVCVLIYTLRHFKIDPISGQYVLQNSNFLKDLNLFEQNSSIYKMPTKYLEIIKTLLGDNFSLIDVNNCLTWMFPFAECRSELINSISDINGFDFNNLVQSPFKSFAKIGPAMPNLLQKHLKEIETLKRVRTLQQRFETKGTELSIVFNISS